VGARLPSGTVTFLFTDIEGSTALWEVAPDAMQAALERHDAVVNSTIEQHEGSVFATGGDGVAAVFARAADALAAASGAQQELAAIDWPTPSPLRVRMGLHTGEATVRDGDYFGAAVNRAARLMAAGHGGQVLVSATTAGLVSTTGLTDLGEHQLRDLAEPQRVFQVGSERFAPLRSLDVALTNLPVQPTTLIGRQPLIAELAELVERCPVVTLTGVGGVGKTRLAVEVGADVLPKFPDGVWLVELAPVVHGEIVVPTVAEVLGVVPQTGEPLVTTLVARLHARRLLVIVDNCEHLLNPVARLVDRLASSAPGVRVLATSREPLGISAERVRAVPSLAESTEAVELFVERASAGGAAFDAPGQLDAAREICRRLDGLPLAIELAAARARMMAPSQIAERLDQRFRLLTGGGRTAVERHRTLQATVLWSYDLLDPADQLVFQRLSTMAGSFDLDAADAVGAGGAVEDWEVLDAIGRLVDKSMVATAAGPDGAVRYRLLETLRQFAADRLAEQPDIDETRDRHARYWTERAIALGRGTRAEGQGEALAAVDIDIDNYRAALAHLLTNDRGDEAARMVLALGAYWTIRRAWEGLRWFEQVLGHGGITPRRRMQLLALAAHDASPLGELDAAEAYATESIALAGELGTTPPWDAVNALMMTANFRGDAGAYKQWWTEGIPIAAASGPYFQLLHDTMRPLTLGSREDLDHYAELTERARNYGAPLLIALAEGKLARAQYYFGEVQEAGERFDDALAWGERTGPSAFVGVLVWTAISLLEAGETDAATSPLARCLRTSRDEGNTFHVIACAFMAAVVAVRRGQFEAAATLLTAGARFGDGKGIGSHSDVLPLRSEAEGAVAAYPGDLSAARARGAAMTIDDLVDEALLVSAGR
jgi:predicted ATPase/class 3 adenylate cyclase